MSRQLAFVAVLSTHASSVIADVRWSDAESGIVTRELVPLKLSALPNFPAADHVAFAAVPFWPLPDASPTAEPDPSSKPYAATRPGVAAEVDMSPGPRATASATAQSSR